METYVQPVFINLFLKLIWWSKISAAKGHPFLFLPKDLIYLVETSKFEILFKKSCKEKFELFYLKNLGKTVQHIIEYQFLIIGRKKC